MISRAAKLLPLALTGLLLTADDVTFRSDVSLIRVDAQVVDRDNRAITGLTQDDFVLREEGQLQQIRHFNNEEMPVDVLLLLDVSGSMQPHIRRVASASHQALSVMGEQDRVAIMVFDRVARLRLPFKSRYSDVENELENLLDQETFNGGTDITQALYQAAHYMRNNARRDARRAIVILTDDQTERGKDVNGILRALAGADTVVSLLLAPNAMQYSRRGGGMGGSWPGGGGGGWPPMGGPLGGVIWGRRGPYGGGNGPVIVGGHTNSAGTAEIAQRSGGDTMNVDHAAAFENTLSRLRQRYSLHFHLPQGVQPGQERNIEVTLADAANRRYPGADVRYRRVYMAPGGADPGVPPPMTSSRGTSRSSGRSEDPAVVNDTPVSQDPDTSTASGSRRSRRRPAVNEDGSRAGGGWRRTDGAESTDPTPADTAAAPASQPAAAPAEEPKRGGWRKLKPGEQP